MARFKSVFYSFLLNQYEISCFWCFCFIVAATFFVQLSVSACPMLEDFPDGTIVYERPDDANLTTFPDNYILRFGCNRGFQKTEPQVILCVNGEWTDEPPSCIKLTCPNPPVTQNGNYEILIGTFSNPVIGSKANYSCSEGFEIADTNSTFLTCVLQKNAGVWKGELPICVEKEACLDPGISRDGWRKGNCCFVGDIVQYSCKRNFFLVGDERIGCLRGGKWSNKRPRCRPSIDYCTDPPAIKNGRVKGYNGGDYYTPFDEAEVVCDSGYAFYGESKYVECGEDLEWEFDFGECKETFCDLPDTVANGTILELESTNRTKFPYKFELNYACDAGFRLIGTSRRLCDKGKWNGKEPLCEAIKCYDPGVLENGFKFCRDLNIGSKVTFNCFSGFNLIGSSERYCLPNGQWSGELTRCDLESNHCSNPGIPINGIKTSDNYDEGDTVEFRCYPGFSLIGSAVRKCLPNRTWSGREAKCLGPYDFDNDAAISESLQESLTEKADEQRKELEKYDRSETAMKMAWSGGNTTVDGRRFAIQTQRILDLNYSGRLILYFVFDVSGSVGKKNFQTSIRFAKALVKKVGITERGARAGALTFSSKAEIQFLPVEFPTTEEVLQAFDRINYTSGGTATNWALQLVHEEMIPLTKGILGPKGLKSVIFILTDGKANTGGSPEEQAKLLKDANVEIYCIGITGSILKNTLYSIASEPTEEHVFVLSNYQTMEWLIQEITNGTIDYSECGLGLEKVGKTNSRQRIIGGNKAIEPWPWMAALYMIDQDLDRPDSSEAELKCGGSIIGQQWILTAAHCTCKKDETVLLDKSSITVRLGLTDIKNFTYLQEFEVAKIVIHPQYSPVNYDNDIALILLNRVIEFNPYVRPICFPPQDLPGKTLLYKEKESAFATGWGYNNVLRKGELVNVRALRNLKELRLPLQSRKRCLQSLLDSEGHEGMFTERMLCAGSGNGEGDTCLGDSGGPLMQSQVNKFGHVYWTQIGIVSWGIGCGQMNMYGYYSHVHKLLPWVNNVLKTTKIQ